MFRTAFVLAAFAALERSAGAAIGATVPGSLPAGSPPTKPPASASSPESTVKHPFSISIVSVDPAAPIAGKPITVAYVVRNLAAGTVLAHVSGTVAGGYPQTLDGKPPVNVAYPGNQEVKGVLVLTGATAGSDSVELTLSTTPCGAAATQSAACLATIFAQTLTTISVAAAPIVPTVRVRIAGATYADIHFRDPADTAAPTSGYEYVSHYPGCRSGAYSTGNNGNDTFFKKKKLPAGAKLVAIDFELYTPAYMKSQYYAGGIGGEGSYGVKLEHDKGDELHVHWENACHYSEFAGYNVLYSISFEIEMPQGTDLGETATPTTQQAYPPNPIPEGWAEIRG